MCTKHHQHRAQEQQRKQIHCSLFFETVRCAFVGFFNVFLRKEGRNKEKEEEEGKGRRERTRTTQGERIKKKNKNQEKKDIGAVKKKHSPTQQRKMSVLLLIALFALVLSAMAHNDADLTKSRTQQVLDHHLDALGSGKLNLIMQVRVASLCWTTVQLQKLHKISIVVASVLRLGRRAVCDCGRARRLSPRRFFSLSPLLVSRSVSAFLRLLLARQPRLSVVCCVYVWLGIFCSCYYARCACCACVERVQPHNGFLICFVGQQQAPVHRFSAEIVSFCIVITSHLLSVDWRLRRGVVWPQDYAHTSVLSLQDGSQYVGKDEIAAVYKGIVGAGGLFEAGTYELQVRTASIVGHVAFIEWSMRVKSTGATYRGTDTFVIEDKTIKSHTVAFFAAPF